MRTRGAHASTASICATQTACATMPWDGPHLLSEVENRKTENYIDERAETGGWKLDDRNWTMETRREIARMEK